MTRRVAVLDAPRNTFGSEPHVIRQRELVARLGARDAGAIETPCCGDNDPMNGAGRRPPERGGSEDLLSFIESLAARTREIVGGREFPVVLGGDCSVLLANMLALRGLGRYGLVFVDGNDEFSYASGRQRHCGYFASAGLDLALATGNGPDALSNLYGLRPYVAERHVVLFGMYRDPGDAMRGDGGLAVGSGGVVDSSPIQQFRMERIREIGARAAAGEALRYLDAQELDGFWIHVDADVLDRLAMGDDDRDADAEAPDGGGLELDELSDALQVFLSSDRAAGLEITLDDPELDPDGAGAQQLVESVVRAFAPGAQ